MLITNRKYLHTFIEIIIICDNTLLHKIFICSLCIKCQTEMISKTYLFCTRL